MAEAAEGEAIKYMLKLVHVYITHIFKSISSAETELEKLKNDLKWMVGRLDDTTKLNVDNTSEQFKIWVSQTRDAIWDTEDLIDIAEAEKNKKFIQWRNKYALTEKIRDFRKAKLDDWFTKQSTKFASLPIAKPPAMEKDQSHRETSIIPIQQMVGLIEDLKKESGKLEIFPIVGMAGIGKTTLARMTCKDISITTVFPTVIWVAISKEFNQKAMLLTILKEFEKNKDFSTKNVGELKMMVRTHLEGRKFLIVFDDLWSTTDWDKIENILPMGNLEHAKVLITTRKSDVADYAKDKSTDLLDLRCLSEDDSWNVLRAEVFREQDKCPSYLVEIGKRLAKQCQGIPLAIMVMGAALRRLYKTKNEIDVEKEWSEFSLHSNDEDGVLKESISQSYKGLSYDLKDCFLYLGVFPDDIHIPVGKLTQLWIAEGFIHERHGKSYEEIAKTHVNDLIDNRLLDVAQKNPDGEVKAVKVHSFIREYCKDEASSIFQEIKWSEGRAFEPALCELKDHRHIRIHSAVTKFLSEQLDFRKARSFLSFPKETTIVHERQLKSIIKAFNMLRILDINMSIQFSRLPDKLSEFVLLNYVTLSSADSKVLPKNIYKLCHVQTLEVYTSSPTLIVNSNIWKLTKLRHFKTKASIVISNKKGNGKGGDKLYTLNRLSPESCTNEVFSKARNLKILGIRGELNRLNESNCCLNEMKSLFKLKLVSDLSGKEADPNALFCLPQSNWFPVNLEILVLSGTSLDWDSMSTIKQLANLKVLKLKAYAFKGAVWNDAEKTGSEVFKSLHTLHILKSNLKLWTASDMTFPTLSELILENCNELQKVPADLVKRLKLLYMRSANKHAVAAAKKIEMEIHLMSGTQAGRNGRFKLTIIP